VAVELAKGDGETRAAKPRTIKEVCMARPSARILALSAVMGSSLLLIGTPAWSDDAVERIVMVRHGEKPATGLGQLDCQGLNRALALPAFIAKSFGKPNAIFAPDPSRQKDDDGVRYDYVRPLATIEPTAIFFGLPVNASFRVYDTDALLATLQQPLYRNALVLVGWEHIQIENIARSLIAVHGGGASVVPKWQPDDFDSIYIVTVTTNGDSTKATFSHRHEGLNGQSKTYPQ
jgi:hypothetical protein